VLGLQQDQFAGHIGPTQKPIHRIEQGIAFENLRNGGFRLAIGPDVPEPNLCPRFDRLQPALPPIQGKMPFTISAPAPFRPASSRGIVNN
jgi:hypothetical protein